MLVYLPGLQATATRWQHLKQWCTRTKNRFVPEWHQELKESIARLCPERRAARALRAFGASAASSDAHAVPRQACTNAKSSVSPSKQRRKQEQASKVSPSSQRRKQEQASKQGSKQASNARSLARSHARSRGRAVARSLARAAH